MMLGTAMTTMMMMVSRRRRVRSLHWIITGWMLWHSLMSEAHPPSFSSSSQRHQRRLVATQPKNVVKTTPKTTAKISAPPPPQSPPPPPPSQGCTASDNFQFQPTVLLTLQGRPGEITSSDLALLQRSMIQAYNMVIDCGTIYNNYLIAANAFIRLEQVNITTNSVQIISSTTSLNSTQDFTLVAATHGDCRGCKTNTSSSFQLWSETSNDTTTRRQRRRHRGLQQQQQTTRQTSQQSSSSSTSSKISLAGSHGGAASLNKAVSAPVTKKNPLSVICKCSVPTKSLFLHAMNTLVPLPTSIDKVLDISNYNPNATTTTTANTSFNTCPDVVNFTSYVTLDFAAGSEDTFDATNLPLQYQVLQQAVVNAYNVANGVNASAGVFCDPQFTILLNATVIVTPDSGYGVTALNRRRRRRRLTNSYTATGTALTFAVQGTCRGCSNNASLFSDPVITGRRRRRRRLPEETQQLLEEEDEVWTDYGDTPFGYPFQQAPTLDRQMTAVNSNCSCATKSIEFRRPTGAEYQIALNDQLEALIASGSLTIVGDAEDSLQVVPVTCTAQVNLFHSLVAVSYAGNASNLTSDQLYSLGQIFQTTYNSLAQGNCDPLFRTIDSVQYVEVEPSTSSSSRRNLRNGGDQDERSLKFLTSTLLFFVSGRCRGCPTSTALFNDAVASGRRLRPLFPTETEPESTDDSMSNHPWLEPQEERALQQNTNQTDQCYCYYFANVTAAIGLDDFSEAYNQTLATTNATATLVVNTVSVPTNLSVTFPPTEAPVPRTHRPTLTPVVPSLSSKPTNRPSSLHSPSALPTLSPVPTISPSLSPGPTTSPSSSPGPTTSPSSSPGPTTNPSLSPGPTTSPSSSPGPSTSPSSSPGPTSSPSLPSNSVTSPSSSLIPTLTMSPSSAPTVAHPTTIVSSPPSVLPSNTPH